MKVQLKHERVFTLVAGARQFEGMRQVSAWEGFIKLEGLAGVVIVHDERGPLTRTLDDAFDKWPESWTVVKASPGILEAINAPNSASGAEAKEQR